MNPFDIGVPCIKISGSEALFEQYRMDLNWDKYDIKVRNKYAKKSNQIFFDFMQRTFNHLDGLYLHENSLLIYSIIRDKSSKQSAV